MEPLTAFFILEGLAFDIIGAYIIVTGLFKIKKLKYSEYLSGLQKKLDNVNTGIKTIEKLLRPENFEKLENETSPKMERKLSSAIKHSINEKNNIEGEIDLTERIDKNLQQDEHTLTRGIRGLPFLIGGFLLQGIGVITQLS